MRPFVKWVGGKRAIIDTLSQKLPQNFNTYHEPFIGGGALFFNLRPKKAVLSDVNSKLVKCYEAIKKNVELVIEQLKEHKSKHNKEYYLECRNKLCLEVPDHIVAGLFIYVNKTCYNGLYRVNSSGGFNVPFGKYENPKILDEENLRSCAKILSNCTLKTKNYDLISANKGDFFYLDPPYHKTYNSYNADKFGEKEHTELANFCEKLDKKGIKFMLSNSNTDLIRTLYQNYNIENIVNKRFVSCKKAQRGAQNELLIRNYE